MFGSSPNRVTALCVLAAYLAATTFGGLFHDHAAHEGDHNCRAHHAGDHDELAGAAGYRAGNSTLHDDDCAACRFAGHRSLGVRAPSTEHFYHLSIALTVAPDNRTVVAVPRTAHSRAPPLPC